MLYDRKAIVSAGFEMLTCRFLLLCSCLLVRADDINDGKSLRDAVNMECEAVAKKVPALQLDMKEEFGLPVISCRLKVNDHQMPQLIVHVPKGYPRKGSATFAFRRPPLG